MLVTQTDRPVSQTDQPVSQTESHVSQTESLVSRPGHHVTQTDQLVSQITADNGGDDKGTYTSNTGRYNTSLNVINCQQFKQNTSLNLVPHINLKTNLVSPQIRP